MAAPSVSVALHPPDFFRLYGPGSDVAPPPPPPTPHAGYRQFGIAFSEPPVFVRPLEGGAQLYDERCLLPGDRSAGWPTPKTELKRLARAICVGIADIAAALRDPRVAEGSERTNAALRDVDALCLSAQHLLARLREPEAWQTVVAHEEALLAGARDALAELRRAKAEAAGL